MSEALRRCAAGSLLAHGALCLSPSATRVFVASAHERVAGGARRLVANGCDGEELHQRFEHIAQLSAFLPIRTISLKSVIATRLVGASGWLCDICPSPAT
jgi:hypothetical protein